MRTLIRAALREDIGPGDVTTKALIPKSKKAGAIILAKGDGVLAGAALISEVFRAVDSGIKIKWMKKDGSRVRRGVVLCRIKGSAASILKAERVALNFLSHLSGIASITNVFVRRIHGTGAKILDTRKTTPGFRELERYAVQVGGGVNHRMGLWDEGLVKDNHWKLVGNSRNVERAIQKNRKRKWVVEISKENLRMLDSIIKARPKVILLDNFSPLELKKIVARIKQFTNVRARRAVPLLEASGGIRLNNVRQIAKTGVDRISVGALTHSAPALDFSLEIKPIR